MLAVWHILALALFIVAPLKGQTPLTCSVRGQCMTQGSFRLGEANATSQEECLQVKCAYSWARGVSEILTFLLILLSAEFCAKVQNLRKEQNF